MPAPGNNIFQTKIQVQETALISSNPFNKTFQFISPQLLDISAASLYNKDIIQFTAPAGNAA